MYITVIQNIKKVLYFGTIVMSYILRVEGYLPHSNYYSNS